MVAQEPFQRSTSYPDWSPICIPPSLARRRSAITSSPISSLSPSNEAPPEALKGSARARM
jgi:hypothetical protein